jgi:hypothetical protein
VLRALALALLLCAGCGDDEVFTSPEQPDLHKTPYDFGVPGKGNDAAVPDLAMPDLAKPDLSTDDLATVD